MSIKITIPNTSSDVLTFGSANTPTAAQIAGIDSGSSNGQLALYTTASGTSTERVRVDASGNVGIGTSSPSGKLHVAGTAATALTSFNSTGTTTAYNLTSITNTSGSAYYGVENSAGAGIFTGSTAYATVLGTGGATSLQFATNNNIRATIDSSGRLGVANSSPDANYHMTVGVTSSDLLAAAKFNRGTTSNTTCVAFANPNGIVGTVNTNGSATSYNTSSDYRLKESIAPMTGALDKVALLKPCTYKWKVDGSDSQGFIAHELQAVVPDCVTGSKDAVDDEGDPKYQGVDTSFLVATLTAAIQEQQALITQLQADVAALKGASA
jgi:hypothetical protein